MKKQLIHIASIVIQVFIAIITLLAIVQYHILSTAFLVSALTGNFYPFSIESMWSNATEHQYLFNLMLTGMTGGLIRHLKENDGWIVYPQFKKADGPFLFK